MKRNLMMFFRSLAVSLSFCALFCVIGYYYLDSRIINQVKNNLTNEPYSYVPASTGVLFDISGNKTLFYLDFEEKSVSVIFADGFDDEPTEIYGYPIDYTVESDHSLLGGIVDIVGGIEFKIGEEELVLTGVQVVQNLTTTPETQESRLEIIKKILSRIAQCGFSRKDFLYIIENSDTNLTVPDCYYWQDSMSELCKTVRIVG